MPVFTVHKENWKENLAIHQKSLGALFQAPLQFLHNPGILNFSLECNRGERNIAMRARE